jgi:3-oxoacyl-[acyl-carrier protein] reductase
VTGGAVEFCEEDETALGEEGVVVFGEVELVEDGDVGVVEGRGFEGMGDGGNRDGKEDEEGGGDCLEKIASETVGCLRGGPHLMQHGRTMNQINLQNRIAVVTGGARGIGRAIVERLLESGASVAIWDLDLAVAEEARVALAGLGRVMAVEVDVTELESVSRAVAATVEEMGKIDILVNNAGIAGANATVWQTDPAEWKRVVDINLNGAFHCCHEVVPEMLRTGYGRIVNIASIAGKEGNPNAAHYSASKAGVVALTKSLGKELAQKGVIVNCVTPAVIETDILKQLEAYHVEYMLSKIPMGRFGKTTEAAALVAWLCSEDCSFTTGAVFDLSGGRATY